MNTPFKPLPEFDFKPSESSPQKNPEKWKPLDRLIQFCSEKWGAASRPVELLKKWNHYFQPDQTLDALSQIKKKNSMQDQINLVLTVLLLLVLLFIWKKGFPLLDQIDQAQNDLTEQAQVIQMEEQNTAFLEKLQKDRNTLQENLGRIYTALPQADERAEEVISMLEDMGRKNNIFIDSITIRKLPETQLGYDDLWGVVEVYEYAFSAESSLPHLLSFIASLRTSMRLMDVMSLEIEEGKDFYKGNFILNAYHLFE